MGALRNWLTTAATCLALGMASSLSAQAILTENFEAGSSLEDLGFTTIDVGGTPETPVVPTWGLATAAETVRDTSRVAYIYFDATNALDDYLITPPLALESGKNYEFFYTVSGGGNSVVDEMDVYLFEGPVPSPENALDIQIFGELVTRYDFFDATELSAATTPRFEEYTLSPATTGTYHVAFYARSLADQYFISIDDIIIYDPTGAPLVTSPQFPENGATDVNLQTYIHFSANPTATSHTVYFSATEADVIAGTAPKLLDDVADVFHADPGALSPNTTYYFRVDATNANGTTEGTVSSFTTRPAAVAAGDVYFSENFDATYLNPPVPPSNLGYPELPKAWDTLDVDGALSAIGVPIGWYISANRPLSAPNAVQTRRNEDGTGPGGSNTTNDDWLFFPEITTHPSLESVLDFNMRTRIGTVAEAPTDDTVEVYWTTTGTNSTNPADYQLQDTLVTSSTTYIPYRYNLPKGETVRFALRYISPDRSQMLVDDVSAQILSPPPTLSILGPANGAVDVNRDTWVYSPADLNAESIELLISSVESEVTNSTVTPIPAAQAGGWYFDPGTLAGNTTYFARIRSTNSFGSVDGPVSSFTTRTAVDSEGGTFFRETFDVGVYSIDGTSRNEGYPELPKGWATVDVDGLTTLAGFAAGFYVEASRPQSAPNSLWSRGSSGTSDDWVFMPPVSTHPTLDTIVRINARGGFDNITEIGDVRTSTNTTSINPADYTNLLGTIETDPDPSNYFNYQTYEYVLPKGQDVRVAVNGRSVDGSRFIMDNIEITILSVPDAQQITYPADGATDVNQVTYLYLPQDVDTDSYTVYFGTNQADVENMTVVPILEDSTDVFFADPGNLAPGTTYYVKVVATNEFGDGEGPVTSFTTRAAAVAEGDVFWAENFDATHQMPRSGTNDNLGYPELPKGWETVDVDGGQTLAGFAAGFYVEASRPRSAPNALWSRGLSDSSTSNDWVFTPPIDTHPTLDTVVRIWARGAFTGTAEIGDVLYSNNTSSINPADYTNLLGTITTDPNDVATYYAYDYVLPKGESVRVAINGRSVAGSRFVLDDIMIFLPSPPPALELARPADAATGVSVNEFLYLPTDPDVASRTVYFSSVESEVTNMSIAPIASNVSETNFVDPGALLPNTTYYARIVSNNDSGSTPGPVTSFTTLPVPTEVGDQFFWESFEGPHFVTGEFDGYPSFPKGWDKLDVDGELSDWTGAPEAWFVFSNISRARTGDNAIVGFYNTSEAQNDDWVFLPQVQTPADKETSVRFWSRVRSGTYPETIEVYVSTTGTNSTDPQDYQLVDTLQDITNLSYEENVYVLPADASVRVALRYTSTFAWYALVDDVEIFISSDTIGGDLGDFNNDGTVNVADVTALAGFLNGQGSVTGDPDYNGDGDFDEDDIVDLADFIVNQ